MKAENRYIGERYGNLKYHVRVIIKKRKEIRQKLAEIRKKDLNKKEQYRQEAQELKEYKDCVSDRVDKVKKQVEGIEQHLDDNAVELAEEVCQTSMKHFQDEDKEEYKPNFQTAK